MKDQPFDRLARALATRVSRRAGMLGTIGAVFGIGSAGGADAARKATRRHEKLACRNAHSECTANEQCCSNRCVPKFGGTSFRCAKSHGRKKKDGNGGNGGGGGQSPVPTGRRCTPGVSVCADSSAQCISRGCGDDQYSYCLKPAGASCTSDGECSIDVCSAGVCAATCTVGPLGSGAPYQTIGDAVDNTSSGAVISIAPGDYHAALDLEDTTRTFRRCCGAGSVVWMTEEGGDLMAYIRGRSADADITFEHIDFRGTAPGEPRESMFYIDGASTSAVAHVTYESCSFSGYTDADSYPVIEINDFSDVAIANSSFFDNDSASEGGAIRSEGNSAARNVLTITDTSFTNNQAGDVPPDPPSEDGGAIYVNYTNATITRCEFSGNAGYSGGALAISTGSNVTVTDTSIEGNSAEEYGGGIYVRAYDDTSPVGDRIVLTLAGTTTVKTNTAATNGGGLAVVFEGAAANLQITGASDKVSANSGGSQCAISDDNSATFTSFSCNYP